MKIAKKKPNGYWTFDRCKQEAAKYNKKSEFEKGSGSAYIISLKNKWIDEICPHMKSPQKPSGYWNEDRCVAEAKKYSKVSDFEKSCPSAIDAARRLGIYKKCVAHMESPQRPKKYWSKEKCKQHAYECKTISEFASKYGFAYNKCLKQGWIDVFEHMERKKSDRDVFYLWRSCLTCEDGKSVYKFGITSKRLGKIRINQCSSSLGISVEEIIVFEELSNAQDIEKEIKSRYERFPFEKGNGHTELVCLSLYEVKKIKEKIRELSKHAA